jgi:hypothetical protein
VSSLSFPFSKDVYPICVPKKFAAILKQDVCFGIVQNSGIVLKNMIPAGVQYRIRRDLTIEAFAWGCVHISIPPDMIEKGRSPNICVGYSPDLKASTLDIKEGLKTEFFSVAERVNVTGQQILVFVHSPIALYNVRVSLFKEENRKFLKSGYINLY